WEKLQEILEFQHPYENIAPVFNIEMGITDVWRDIDFYKEERYHSTQKPVNLIERIIKASSNEEMIILDPFMGSGTTALACLNLNRHYIGIEKEEKYIQVAQRRIEEYKSSLLNRYRFSEVNQDFVNQKDTEHSQLELPF
ncbi:MAG: DNA-methyltransferase, partial [Dolichospermum sp.]